MNPFIEHFTKKQWVHFDLEVVDADSEEISIAKGFKMIMSHSLVSIGGFTTDGKYYVNLKNIEFKE